MSHIDTSEKPIILTISQESFDSGNQSWFRIEVPIRLDPEDGPDFEGENEAILLEFDRLSLLIIDAMVKHSRRLEDKVQQLALEEQI